jgi:hypothetical protein
VITCRAGLSPVQAAHKEKTNAQKENNNNKNKKIEKQ